ADRSPLQHRPKAVAHRLDELPSRYALSWAVEWTPRPHRSRTQHSRSVRIALDGYSMRTSDAHPFRSRPDGRTSQIALRESWPEMRERFRPGSIGRSFAASKWCVGSVAADPRNLAWLQPQLRRAEANSSPLANTGSPDPTIGPPMLDGCRPNK